MSNDQNYHVEVFTLPLSGYSFIEIHIAEYVHAMELDEAAALADEIKAALANIPSQKPLGIIKNPPQHVLRGENEGGRLPRKR